MRHCRSFVWRLLLIVGIFCSGSLLAQGLWADQEGLQTLAQQGQSLWVGSPWLASQGLGLLLLLGAGLVPVLLGAWLLCQGFRWKGRELPLAGGAMAVLVLLGLAEPALLQVLLLVLTAVLFPGAVAWTLAAAAQREPAWLQQRSLPQAALLAAGGLLGWSLLGGLQMAALLVSRVRLTGDPSVPGGQVALLVPVLLGSLLMLVGLYGRLRPVKTNLWPTLFLGALLCGLYIAFVIQAGDWAGETSLAAFLAGGEREALLPRPQEVLLAAPCLPLFLWACRRELWLLPVLFGVGSTLEGALIVGAFCQGGVPLWVSFLRVLLSGGLGLVVGLLGMGLLEWAVCRFLRTHPGMDQAT